MHLPDSGLGRYVLISDGPAKRNPLIAIISEKDGALHLTMEADPTASGRIEIQDGAFLIQFRKNYEKPDRPSIPIRELYTLAGPLPSASTDAGGALSASSFYMPNNGWSPQIAIGSFRLFPVDKPR